MENEIVLNQCAVPFGTPLAVLSSPRVRTIPRKPVNLKTRLNLSPCRWSEREFTDCTAASPYDNCRLNSLRFASENKLQSLSIVWVPSENANLMTVQK